jgi:type I restriction enzyme M protein
MKLGDICEINNKTSDPESLFGKSDFVYIDISSVENGTGKISYENEIATVHAPSRARRLVESKDVLLSTVRPNLRAYAYLEKLPSKVLASTGFAVITAKEAVLPKYVYNILFTDNLQNQMVSKMGKGAYPSINQSDVENLVIPVPSLKLQEELVAEYDQQENVIATNTSLIEIMEKKIDHIISELA